jgi:uncharacterized protein with GYD domain
VIPVGSRTCSRFRSIQPRAGTTLPSSCWKQGGSFEAIAWTIGPYDLVSIVNVPDEETGAAFNLQLAASGNLRSVTMRAFTEDEMSGIVAKMD